MCRKTKTKKSKPLPDYSPGEKYETPSYGLNSTIIVLL